MKTLYNSMKLILFIVGLMLLIAPVSAWVTGYDHRMPIENNNTGDYYTYGQYNFIMDTAAEIAAGNMTSDNGSDCCVADSYDVLQSFWNETAFNLSDTKIHVNASSLDNVTNTTHYIYYGQFGASSLINGTTTFEFFDNFTTLDWTNKWESTDQSKYSVSGGYLSAAVPGAATNLITTQNDFTDFIVEIKHKNAFFSNGLLFINMADSPATFVNNEGTQLDGTGGINAVIGGAAAVGANAISNNWYLTKISIPQTGTAGAYVYNYSYTEEWETKEPIPYAVSDMPGAVYDDKLYIFGGFTLGNTNYTNKTQVYTSATDSWIQKADMPTSKDGAAATEFNGDIYVFSGASSAGNINETCAYNVMNDSWMSKTDTPSNITGTGLMSVKIGTKIYIFYEYYVYEFDPTGNGGNGSYALLNDSAPVSRIWATCAYVNVGGEDRVYLIGGMDRGTMDDTDVNYYFDIVNTTWSSAQPAAPYSAWGTLRDNPVIDNQIYYGFGLNSPSTFYGYLYSYNPETATWSSLLGTAQHIRDGVACGIINNELYAVGGRASSAAPISGLNYNEKWYGSGQELIVSKTGTPSATTKHIGILQWNEGMGYADWVFVRKYVVDLTTSIGAEESAPSAAPIITLWQNNKTFNNTLYFIINTSEEVIFNATANQTIITWNWYKDDVNQSYNYDNITLNWSVAGSKTVKVNAINSNGTSNTIIWNVTVVDSGLGPTPTPAPTISISPASYDELDLPLILYILMISILYLFIAFRIGAATIELSLIYLIFAFIFLLFQTVTISVNYIYLTLFLLLFMISIAGITLEKRS